MTYKKATYIALSGILLLSVIFLVTAFRWKIRVQAAGVGPSYFPIGLTILLIFLCLLSWFKTWRAKANEKIKMPNRLFYTTLIVVSIFLTSWYVIGYFYLNLFLFLIALIYFYVPKNTFKKTLRFNVLLAAGILLFVYILFDVVINLRL